MSYINLWIEPKPKSYTATISLEISIEFTDTDPDNARNYAWDVAEELASYVSNARGDYSVEPEITDVTVKEEPDD